MIVSFLWHGTIRIHTGARVGWMDICFPKSERGLGIRNIVAWSETCILKASSYGCSTSKLAQYWFAWMTKIYNVSSFWRKQKCLSQMYGLWFGLDEVSFLLKWIQVRFEFIRVWFGDKGFYEFRKIVYKISQLYVGHQNEHWHKTNYKRKFGYVYKKYNILFCVIMYI